MTNTLKERLKRKELTLGSWVTIGHPEVAEILSQSGFDWLLFDMEHAPITVAQLEPMLQVASRTGTLLTRVPANDPVFIKQVLDVGSHGVMVPAVGSKEEAERAVSYSKYPPFGVRGTGARRASGYYTRHTEYLMRANSETMVVVQIETKEGVSNFEQIVTTKGVDAWFVGPNDLAASLGYLGNPDSQVVRDVMKELVMAGNRLDVPGGTIEFRPDRVKVLAEMGYRMIAVGSDDFFLSQASVTTLSELGGIR
jgi:2-dehydro-3-deoxyglucarate aldolase